MPLMERNPLFFWRSIALLELLIILLLVYKNLPA
jgi:hypothetical protein